MKAKNKPKSTVSVPNQKDTTSNSGRKSKKQRLTVETIGGDTDTENEVMVNSYTDTYGGNFGTTLDSSRGGVLSWNTNPFERHKHSTSSKNLSLQPLSPNAKHTHTHTHTHASSARYVKSKNVRFNEKNKQTIKEDAGDISDDADLTNITPEPSKHITDNCARGTDSFLSNIPNIEALESSYLKDYYSVTRTEFSLRAVCIGLTLGCVLCLVNLYFGLQSGSIVIGSLQSSLFGYCVLQVLQWFGFSQSSPLELNMIQTVSVASASMPFAAGLVSIIPALATMSSSDGGGGASASLSAIELYFWTLCVALLGLFLAVPLRHQTVLREELTFPSGVVNAKLINILLTPAASSPDSSESSHSSDNSDVPYEANPATVGTIGTIGQATSVEPVHPTLSMLNLVSNTQTSTATQYGKFAETLDHPDTGSPLPSERSLTSPNTGVKHTNAGPYHPPQDLVFEDIVQKYSLGDNDINVTDSMLCTCCTGCNASDANKAHKVHKARNGCNGCNGCNGRSREWNYLTWGCFFSLVVRVLSVIFPVLTRLPLMSSYASKFKWNFAVNLGLIGQGLIVGPRVGLSMLAGAVLAWGVLGPVAIGLGWVETNALDDYDDVTKAWAQSETCWVVWVAVSLMLADGIVALLIIFIQTVWDLVETYRLSYANLNAVHAHKKRKETKTVTTETMDTRHTQDLNDMWHGGLEMAHMQKSYTSRSDQVKFTIRMDIHKTTEDLELGGLGGNGHSADPAVTPPWRAMMPTMPSLQSLGVPLLQDVTSGDGDTSQSKWIKSCNSGKSGKSGKSSKSGKSGENGTAPGTSGKRSKSKRGEFDMNAVRNEYLQWLTEHMKEQDKSMQEVDAQAEYQAFLDLFFNQHIRDDFVRDCVIPKKIWIPGLAATLVLCLVSLSVMQDLQLQWNQIFLALAASVVVAFVSARALGETNINPVQSVGYLSQTYFWAVGQMSTRHDSVETVLSSVGLAEGCAWEAGGMMNSFKTGYILLASAKNQFYGQIIGTLFSVCLSVLVYVLMTASNNVTKGHFAAPFVSDVNKLVDTDIAGIVVVPKNVLPFCATSFAIGSVLAILNHYKVSRWIPSGMALAVGMFVKPNHILPRVLGSGLQYLWYKNNPVLYKKFMMVIAASFMLGDGLGILLAAMFTAMLTACGLEPVN